MKKGIQPGKWGPLKGRPKDRSRDRELLAMPPGLRVSASGKKYFEYRANRADISKKKRL